MKKFIIFLLVVTLLTSTALAQEKANNKVPKDEGTATLLSVLITGGGQFYAEETNKGLALLLIGGGSLVVGAILGSAIPKKTDLGYGITTEEYNSTFFWLGTAVYLGTWIYGIADAPKAVRRYNQKYGFSLNNVKIKPFFARDRRAGASYGLTLSLNLN